MRSHTSYGPSSLTRQWLPAAAGFRAPDGVETRSSLGSHAVVRITQGRVGPTCSGKVHGQVVHIRLPSRYSRQMPLDADLLNQAEAAEARVIDAEQAAEIARAEFHGRCADSSSRVHRCARS